MDMYLHCINASHHDILLPDGKPTFIGRSAQTKITDKKCSRQQLEVVANYGSRSIQVNVVGTTPTTVNNNSLQKGDCASMKENEILYIINNLYPHKLIVLDNKPESTSSKKRTISDFFGGDNKAKKSRVDQDNKEHSDKEELEVMKKLSILQQKNSPIMPDVKCPEIESTSVLTTDSTRPPGWYKEGSDMLVFETKGLKHSNKVTAFDMDSTLITTKSGKTFAVDKNDWKILYSEIPRKLKEIISDGAKIVIITNQLGIGKGKVKESDFKDKIEALLKKLGVPCQVIAIIKRGKNRKPNIGTWKWIKNEGNGGTELNNFIYVGDAAGRPKNWAPGRKKDFSCGDRLFALNLGVPFYTPEEFFLGQKPAKFDMPEFNPKSLLSDLPLTEGGPLTTDNQEVIVMVGYPASGKSTFVKQNLLPKGYYHINRDKMKTWQKCVAACKQALTAGKSVVVDNTNPDIASRKRYVDCAKEVKCQCRCFLSKTSIEHAFHNNRFRELSGDEHDIVPAMILYSFRKNFVEPKKSEGFDEIVKFNFVPQFADKEQENMYRMFLD